MLHGQQGLGQQSQEAQPQQDEPQQDEQQQDEQQQERQRWLSDEVKRLSDEVREHQEMWKGQQRSQEQLDAQERDQHQSRMTELKLQEQIQSRDNYFQQQHHHHYHQLQPYHQGYQQVRRFGMGHHQRVHHDHSMSFIGQQHQQMRPEAMHRRAQSEGVLMQGAEYGCASRAGSHQWTSRGHVPAATALPAASEEPDDEHGACEKQKPMAGPRKSDAERGEELLRRLAFDFGGGAGSGSSISDGALSDRGNEEDEDGKDESENAFGRFLGRVFNRRRNKSTGDINRTASRRPTEGLELSAGAQQQTMQQKQPHQVHRRAQSDGVFAQHHPEEGTVLLAPHGPHPAAPSAPPQPSPSPLMNGDDADIDDPDPDPEPRSLSPVDLPYRSSGVAAPMMGHGHGGAGANATSGEPPHLFPPDIMFSSLSSAPSSQGQQWQLQQQQQDQFHAQETQGQQLPQQQPQLQPRLYQHAQGPAAHQFIPVWHVSPGGTESVVTYSSASGTITLPSSLGQRSRINSGSGTVTPRSSSLCSGRPPASPADTPLSSSYGASGGEYSSGGGGSRNGGRRTPSPIPGSSTRKKGGRRGRRPPSAVASASSSRSSTPICASSPGGGGRQSRASTPVSNVSSSQSSPNPYVARGAMGAGQASLSTPGTPHTPSSLGDESLVLRGMCHIPPSPATGATSVNYFSGQYSESSGSGGGGGSSAEIGTTSSLDLSSPSAEHGNHRSGSTLSVGGGGSSVAGSSRRPLPLPPSFGAVADQVCDSVPERLEHNRRRSRSTSVSVLSESDRRSLLASEASFSSDDEPDGDGNLDDDENMTDIVSEAQSESIMMEDTAMETTLNDEVSSSDGGSLRSFLSEGENSLGEGGRPRSQSMPTTRTSDAPHRTPGTTPGRTRPLVARTGSDEDGPPSLESVAHSGGSGSGSSGGDPRNSSADQAAGFAVKSKSSKKRGGDDGCGGGGSETVEGRTPPPPPPPMHPPRHPSSSFSSPTLQDLSQPYPLPPSHGRNASFGSRTSHGSRTSLRSNRSSGIFSDQSSYVSSDSSEEDDLDAATDSSDEEQRSLPVTPCGRRLRSVSTSGESNMVEEEEISEISSSTTSSFSLEEGEELEEVEEPSAVAAGGKDDNDPSKDGDPSKEGNPGKDERDKKDDEGEKSSAGRSCGIDSAALRAHEERCKDEPLPEPIATVMSAKKKKKLAQVSVPEQSRGKVQTPGGRVHCEVASKESICLADIMIVSLVGTEEEKADATDQTRDIAKECSQEQVATEEEAADCTVDNAGEDMENSDGGDNSDHDPDEAGDNFGKESSPMKSPSRPRRQTGSTPSPFKSSRSRIHLETSNASEMSYSESECSHSVSQSLQCAPSLSQDYDSPRAATRKGYVPDSPGLSEGSPLTMSGTLSRVGSRNDLSMFSSDGEGDLAAGDRSNVSGGRPAALTTRSRGKSDGSSASGILQGVAHLAVSAAGASPSASPRHPSLDLTGAGLPPTAIPCSLTSGADGISPTKSTTTRPRHRRHRSDGILNSTSLPVLSRTRTAGGCAPSVGTGKKPLAKSGVGAGVGGRGGVTHHRRSKSHESSLQVIFENISAAEMAASEVLRHRRRLRRTRSTGERGDPSLDAALVGAPVIKRAKQTPPAADGERAAAEQQQQQQPAERLGRRERAHSADEASLSSVGVPQRPFTRGFLLGAVLTALLLTSCPPALLDLLRRRRAVLLLPLLGLSLFSGRRSFDSDLLVVQVKFPTAAFRRMFGLVFLAAAFWCCTEEARSRSGDGGSTSALAMRNAGVVGGKAGGKMLAPAQGNEHDDCDESGASGKPPLHFESPSKGADGATIDVAAVER